MDVDRFLDELRADPDYLGQIVHVHEVAPRQALYGELPAGAGAPLRRALDALGIERLYAHQVEAVEAALAGEDVVVQTGTASGKTACYAAPVLAAAVGGAADTSLLLFPAKALCQDQFRHFGAAAARAGVSALAGVYDGDTPAALRRRLRDGAGVLFSNPDMVHAALLPQHARWARFLASLRTLVIDELHVYSGILGTNMAHLLTRLLRVCAHYGSRPRIVAASATVAGPAELAGALCGRRFRVVDRDGSPCGRRVYVFWNPPRIRETASRSRRSANVEAREIMARLVARGVPTIAFTKARMTAEMLYRYVRERLFELAPAQVDKVTPYRGGYLPEERREIERRLFDGRLLGVSTTRALELGIDVGGLDAAIVVGYPGTRASFFQQTGRAGRRTEDAVAFLVGLDTTINQYVMHNPGYIFDRPVEEAVIDWDNPFVVTGHLRCAAHELPLGDEEVERFGRHAALALDVLEGNGKIRRAGGRRYYAAAETPQHEVSLRDCSGANVIVQDVESGRALGEMDRLDAPPIVHPGAVYMHLGETYLVESLDMERNLAMVRRADVDYYTQPLGGTDVHHIDHRLREKAFGTGQAFWGEVTTHSRTYGYERVHFYSLDALAVHGVDLPTIEVETMAFWLVPPESLMEAVRQAGLDAHGGLRGIGYAVRMLLPLFMTCDTLDFSHTVGAINAPWNAVFVFERYPHGLGFTRKAFDRLGEIVPAVLRHVEACPCEEGCPCCVGKPLRQYAVWNVERGEGMVPSKAAALAILRGVLGGGRGLAEPEAGTLTGGEREEWVGMERSLRRRLERMGDPTVFHPIVPAPEVRTEYPLPERSAEAARPDPAKRAERRAASERELKRRIAQRIALSRSRPTRKERNADPPSRP